MKHGAGLASRWVFSAGNLLVLALAACTGKNVRTPGQAIGDYQVTATRIESTCPEAPATWDFRARLRADGEDLFWDQGVSSLPELQNTGERDDLLDDRKAEFVATTNNKPTETAACFVERKDALSLTLSVARTDLTSLRTFEGTLDYQFRELSEACTDAERTAAQLSVLPCRSRFKLVARRIEK
jgi:hypothetical protein